MTPARSLACLAMLLVPLGAAAQSCPQPVPLEQIAGHLDRAEEILNGGGDSEAFGYAVDDALLDLPCVDTVVDTGLAVRLHLAHGIMQNARQNDELCDQAFRAAARLDPAADLPSVFTESTFARRAWNAAKEAEPTEQAVDRPAAAVLLFDGVETLQRPTDRTTIIQIREDDGSVTHTMYMTPRDAMPAYEVDKPQADLHDPQLPEGDDLREPWGTGTDVVKPVGVGRKVAATSTAIGAVAVGALSAATFVQSANRYQTYTENASDRYFREEFQPVRNAALIEGVGALALGITSGALWTIGRPTSAPALRVGWHF